MVKILVNDQAFEVEVLNRSKNSVEFSVKGRQYRVELAESLAPTADPVRTKTSSSTKANISRSSNGPNNPKEVCAPISGLVTDIAVAVGDNVEAGTVLVRLEAMKMQNNIFASVDGKIAEILVDAGDEVRDGQVLVRLK